MLFILQYIDGYKSKSRRRKRWNSRRQKMKKSGVSPSLACHAEQCHLNKNYGKRMRVRQFFVDHYSTIILRFSLQKLSLKRQRMKKAWKHREEDTQEKKELDRKSSHPMTHRQVLLLRQKRITTRGGWDSTKWREEFEWDSFRNDSRENEVQMSLSIQWIPYCRFGLSCYCLYSSEGVTQSVVYGFL